MEKALEHYLSLMDTRVDRTRTEAEKYTLRQRLFGTEDVLPMWVADMDIITPPFVTQAVQRRAQHPIYGYEMMPQSAFEAQASWLARRHGLHVTPQQMYYSPSVVASINLAIQAFTAPGERVIVQPPVYSPFMKSVTNNDRELLLNPLKQDESGSYRFDFDDLRSKIDKRTKLLLLCSPHNPVGRVWSEAELRELGEICLEHGIIIFADEIHSDLIFAPHAHTPLSSLSKSLEAISVTAYGPGKTFNLAGVAISTLLIGNEGLRTRFEKVYESVHFAEGTVFGHVAFEAAYREGDVWVDALMGYLSQNQNMLQETLKETPFTCKASEGTYLAWIACHDLGLKDKALREFFIQKMGLGLSPGITFGREGSGYMRLNMAVPHALMHEAMERMRQPFR